MYFQNFRKFKFLWSEYRGHKLQTGFRLEKGHELKAFFLNHITMGRGGGGKPPLFSPKT